MLRFALILLLAAAGAAADDVRVDVRADADELRVDWATTDLLDDDVERALQSGLPARVRTKVELWRAATFFDRFVVDHRSEVRVRYDLLEERYEIYDDVGEILLSTPERDSLQAWLHRIEDFPLCALEDLDLERPHYVTVEIELAPLTLEEMRDLERWLAGNLRRDDDGSMIGRVSRQLFGVLKGRVGLGDREVSGRSERFVPARWLD